MKPQHGIWNLIFIVTLLFITHTRASPTESMEAAEETRTELDISFTPANLDDLIWRHSQSVVLTINCSNVDIDDAPYVALRSSNTDVIDVTDNERYLVNCSATNSFEYEVYANRLGHANLTAVVEYGDGSSIRLPHNLHVTVEHDRTALNDIFIIVIAVFMVVLSFGFGCRMQVEVLKEILKRPVAPAIGLACQFLLMPILGIALTQLLRMDPLLGFGLFVVSCSPGGGGSNVWTVLLDGDIDLSMTMTLFSKTLGLGTMPAWLFAAGRLYGDISFDIPYFNLIVGLASIAFPCLLGIWLRWWKEKIAKFISRLIKIVSALFLAWLIIVGSIANYYVYPVMVQQWYTLPAAILLPYMGVIFGGIVAKLFRQSKARSVTIAIETGVQDTGVAILLLLSSFGRPDGAIAAAVPIAAAIFTPIPFAIASIVINVRNKCWLQGKCQSCGGPSKREREKGSPEMVGLRVDSRDITFSEATLTNNDYNYDVPLDKNGYVDDGCGDNVRVADKNNSCQKRDGTLVSMVSANKVDVAEKA